MNPRSAIITSVSVALTITIIVFGHLLFPKKTTALDNIRDGSVDTSGWKTYTNGQFGFKIKYPNSWVPGLQETDNITGKMVSVSLMKPYQNGDTKIPTAAIQFFIQYNGKGGK